MKQGKSLDKAELLQVNLKGAKLLRANFKEANLMLATLQDAELFAANLQNADLFGANLSKTDLRYAELQKAQLGEAELEGAFLGDVVLDGALNLTWSQIGKIGEEEEHDWEGAKDAYLLLKNYFHQQGRYGDESKTYFKEKIMARKMAWEYGTDKNSPLINRVEYFVRWLGLSFFHVFTGFGERWWWTVLWALGIIAFFGFLYWGGGAAGWFQFAFKPEMIPSIFQYFYLSVVTFATLGFGDITPLNWQAQIPVIIEVIMGYVFLGLIITIIARRFGR